MTVVNPDAAAPRGSGSLPPFTSPLPPSVPLPSPIQLIPAVPPSQHGYWPNPWTPPSAMPLRGTPPGPLRPIFEHPELRPGNAGGLRQALAEYDRRLGLGPSGALATVARRLGGSETMMGSARLEVLVDRTGNIQSVSILDASEDLPGWRHFAHILRATPVPGMRFAEEAQGVWMLLDVNARNALPSGHRRVWEHGSTLVFDVADFGARKSRVVHTSIASERPF